MNFSEARSNLKQVLDEVAADHSVTLIKRRDAGDAVVMSLADYSAMEETMYLLSTPANAGRLMVSVAEAEKAFPGVRVLGPLDIASTTASSGKSGKPLRSKPRDKARA